jgi:hypothetical protein
MLIISFMLEPRHLCELGRGDLFPSSTNLGHEDRPSAFPRVTAWVALLCGQRIFPARQRPTPVSAFRLEFSLAYDHFWVDSCLLGALVQMKSSAGSPKLMRGATAVAAPHDPSSDAPKSPLAEKRRIQVTQVLALELRSGDMVSMNSVPNFKCVAKKQKIEANGVILPLPPPYGPDFNPIE